ncbi:MAG: ABC transporter permease, partial [Clostridia bacterium]|nr:ABC transporter permease [Clostridia bacterium]
SEIIQRASNYLSQLSIATEDEYYLDNSLRSRYDTYNDYVNYMHEQRASTRDALKMTAYSLEHNIPIQGVVSESAKSSWKNNINSLINISTYIMIAMSVLIISNEYTSGSIRLLLIRPRKRYKILLSKLVSLAMYWGMMLLGSFVITFVLNMILYKSSDLLVPELNIVGGNVVEINAIVSMLIYTFTKIASVLPMLLLSFLLAIVMRRAALPIVLPVMIQGVSSVAQVVSMSVIEIDGMEFIKYLPFAYSDMTVFFTNPVGLFMYNNSFDIGSIFGNIFTYDMVSQFIPLIGIIYLVAFIAIEITLSFIVFIKQQIKN